jgi:hypothetical protein
MSQITLEELQTQLSRYLENRISLDEFRDWFDDETWGLAAEPDSALRRMAGKIELRVAEFTNGHLTEDELRDLFRPLVPVVDFQLPVRYAEPLVEMISS